MLFFIFTLMNVLSEFVFSKLKYPDGLCVFGSNENEYVYI